MAAVVLDNLSKVYPPDIAAVRDLSLSVADGECLVLVGPSGSGKTTVLRLIAGLEAPTAGRITINGRPATDLPPRDRDVALVFQRPTVYPHLSVRDNLAFGLRLRQTNRWLFRRRSDEVEVGRRVAEVAALLRLEDVLDRRADQLSGGQQQRVALGRAVARRPAVFLLDEPLSHLDSRLRAEMRRELHLLHKRIPATIIHVTHDPVEALALADRVAVLAEGRLQQVDRPQTVWARPGNRRVADLFGAPPMNLLDGVTVVQDGRPAFRTADGAVTLPLPDDWAQATQVGQAVTLGVRPEGLALLTEDGTIPVDGAGPTGTALRMQVVLVEPTGERTLVTLQRERTRLTAVTAGQQSVTDGQSVVVVFDMNRTHLFDGATGQALGHGSQTG